MLRKLLHHANTDSPHYKWIALSNTTLGVLMAAINGSITIISLPAIFRGINLDPLQAGNINYLLWTLMGFMVCTAVLVVTFGRLGDMFGRAKMYNGGFAVFTLASIALSLTPGHGSSAALYIIGMRIIQGLGAALLFANSTAILTDAFPANQRGLALGINTIAGIGGSFIGLLVGGLLADLHWRLVFWVSVPFGVIGTAWAYLALQDTGRRVRQSIDWLGNITFALGLILILVGITYGIQPYGGHVMGWSSPKVLGLLTAGGLLLISFVFVERRVKNPLFDLRLFKIRAFAAGNIASLLAAVGRGGLQFMLIIWLQGIWLPLHGYSFEKTPLWAGIFMLPLTVGFLVAGPLSGYLSDRFGARPFATGGMLVAALSFFLLMLLPADFPYWAFAIFIFLNGAGSGLFAAPNSSGIMNAVPPSERGQASGMRATTMNAGMVLSIGIFFSLIIIGLASTLPHTMQSQLTAQKVPAPIAHQIATAPPVGSLFAAFLGYNPMTKLIPASTLQHLPAHNQAVLTGKQFFPHLISGPFMHGLKIAFTASLILFLLAAVASWLRGGQYFYSEAGGKTGETSQKDRAEAEKELVGI
ncbi:MAG TPA: MFS transporter [Candidatus Saccharimonadales bacterium]|nr:MFS transporter [Candidatus Saccharimonadales bacterium]